MPSKHYDENEEPTSSSNSNSGTTTPSLSASASWNVPPSLSSSMSYAVSGLLRRFSSETTNTTHNGRSPPTFPPKKSHGDGTGVYTPPYRTASPFQPPPLYPIILKGYNTGTDASAQLLSRALAEEIRLLVPARLQLCEDWNLIYSLDQDGVSLGTLYKKCDELRGKRNGFVLVVKDGEGGLFGAYLTEAPHPSPHYFGTGECFLWRASIISPISTHHLPPPPSTDTTNLQRSTTIGIPKSPLSLSHLSATSPMLAPPSPALPSGASTPERIRFKAFPYSGVNDYMMLCESSFLSVGGGDGKYGLWLDDNFEHGISSSCLTFGNEPLSDEGEKFDILGAECWTIGNM